MKNNIQINSPLGDGGYRQYPAISNSDLTEFRDFIFGIKRFKPVNAFGSAFHEVLLEPKAPHIFPESVDKDQILHLSNKVRENKFCKWALQFSRKEQGFLFDDVQTNLPCKAKIDMVLSQNLIVDFKTTSQRSEAAFLKSCLEYEYDRQAAFYLDAVSTSRRSLSEAEGRKIMKFIFVGVQKKAPYDLYIFDTSKDAAFIEQGRKKYKALLRRWKEMGGVPNAFVPSTWNIELLNQAA
ncbi:hypothetical protein GCM10011514_07340 [Emticicia aquatilis]|uniref:Putative exodeoxyribonuclease 8 PDDEXK-like domain-containing protein n=1 Tax=Emticicia aquatilis TaxID=1537369 RepID=A0A917DJW2_9BACT|nr:PD-(D/E)XK nuclease-like domain-containing protein [Emticicia aquatilis]GGD45886.1 hypothetical protein GCM10011514_07340 [Emticicia aquatilis]